MTLAELQTEQLVSFEAQYKRAGGSSSEWPNPSATEALASQLIAPLTAQARR